MEISNIQVSDNIIEIICSGPVSGEGLIDLIDKVKVILGKKQEIENILVDLTGIDGKLSFIEHFKIGEGIAKKLKSYKLAVVTKPIVVNKVAENVATKEGARMLMTYDRQKALSWFKQ
ncbi:MAG: hypothetical protein WCE54_02580 [Ignavibacteriaceae bacterium]